MNTNSGPNIDKTRCLSFQSRCKLTNWKAAAGIRLAELTHNTNSTKGKIPMIMIRAIVRPEKVDEVLSALMYAAFRRNQMDVYGRGKQRGVKSAKSPMTRLPKEILLTVVPDNEKDFVIETIMKSARTGHKGAFGDGKIFVSAVEEIYTVSSGQKEV
jgi:nitrogen regulatory protein PII 1